MHPNADTITKFYAAFAQLDPEAMGACYADDVRFDDEVFSLRGKAQVMGMWRMLCARGKDLRVEASGIQADAERGRAHWRAAYSYGPTARPVVNEIDATFAFRRGLIVEHVDRFDLRRWATQALGLSGRVLGLTPLLGPMVRKQAAASLAAWRRRESAE